MTTYYPGMPKEYTFRKIFNDGLIGDRNVNGNLVLSGDAAGAVGNGSGANWGLITSPVGRIEQDIAVNATYGTNFLQVFWLPDCAGRFRVISASGGASYTIAKQAIRPIVGDSDFNASGNDWATLGIVKFGGNNSGVVPARPAAGGRRCGLIRSDWISRSPTARTDNGPGFLIGVRTYVAGGAGTIVLNGAASQSVTNHASRADKKFYVARAQHGDATTQDMIATPAAFTSTTNVSYGPVVGIEFIANGRMFTLLVGGDSIDSGAGATLYGDGFWRRACDDLSTELGVPVNFASCAWGGATYDEYADNLQAWIDLGIRPDAVALPIGSPNGVAQWDVSSLNAVQLSRSKMDSVLHDARIPVLRRAVLPANVSAKTWGASDAARVALNSQWAAYGNFADVATPLTGLQNVSGQWEFAVGLTDPIDGLHPNDPGHEAAKTPAKDLIRRVAVRKVKPQI